MDRFCNALIEIRKEVAAIERGEVSRYAILPRYFIASRKHFDVSCAGQG